jgi:hypothetical protein
MANPAALAFGRGVSLYFEVFDVIAEAASRNLDPRKTKTAAPVCFSRWLKAYSGLPAAATNPATSGSSFARPSKDSD